MSEKIPIDPREQLLRSNIAAQLVESRSIERHAEKEGIDVDRSGARYIEELFGLGA